jgi:hypothetical protein
MAFILNKGPAMKNKNHENVTTLEIFGAAILGAVIGGGLALIYVLRTGGF